MQRVYYGTVCQGGTSYGIVFLDFLGCVSAGDSLEEVIAMGHEALQLHIDGMAADGDAIPEPSTVTIERTIAELDDPDDPIPGEEWTMVLPILVDVPASTDSRPIRLKARLVHEIAEASARSAAQIDTADFVERAVEHELDRYRKSA